MREAKAKMYAESSKVEHQVAITDMTDEQIDQRIAELIPRFEQAKADHQDETLQ